MKNNKEQTIHLEGEQLEDFLLALAKSIIQRLPKQPPKPETVEKFGAATLAVGRALIRGVPNAMAVEAANQILAVPAEMASDFVDSVSEMITTVTIADLAGEQVGIAVDKLTDYSSKKDRMDEMACVTACMGAFVARDYSRCVTETQRTLKNYPKALPFQLLMISLQRLKRSQDVEAQGRRALAALTFASWHQALMRITLGQAEATTVYGNAKNEDERCQVRFYEGARHLTLGDPLKARLALTECVRSSSGLMEHVLASAEMESVQDLKPDVEQIILSIVKDTLRDLVRKRFVHVSDHGDDAFAGVANGGNFAQATSIIRDIIILLLHREPPERVVQAVDIHLAGQGIPKDLATPLVNGIALALEPYAVMDLTKERPDAFFKLGWFQQSVAEFRASQDKRKWWQFWK